MHRFIDLFAGIGGFHVALQRQGMDCVFASEIDVAAANAYEKNFNMAPAGDICTIPSRSIPAHDVLCAGFPCQPFSRSGNGKAFADTRGRLFYEIVRIAKHHKPSLLLLENVKAILTIDNGNVSREIYDSLDKIGYKVDHYMLNAGNFGIPQKRERVYFVAVRKDSPLGFSQPVETRRCKVVGDIILTNIETRDLMTERDDIVFDKPKKQDRAMRPLRIGYLNKGGQGERIYSTNGQAITLSANGGGVGHRTGLYLVGDVVRRLHIDEAKQVMGFRKQHYVSPGIAGYRQLGNAVIPGMVSKIYDSVRIA